MPLPVVLGHEGAGVVEAAGSAVQKVQPGDHVAIRFLACGRCRPNLDGSSASCANFNAMNFAGRRQDGSHALTLSDGDAPSDRFFGQSSFAGNAIAHESNVVKVRKDAPLELVGPLGCGIQTGAGTGLRALKVTAGSSFAVTGAGTVGLSAVMAALGGRGDDRHRGGHGALSVGTGPGGRGDAHGQRQRAGRPVRDPADHRRGRGLRPGTTGLPALILQAEAGQHLTGPVLSCHTRA